MSNVWIFVVQIISLILLISGVGRVIEGIEWIRKYLKDIERRINK